MTFALPGQDYEVDPVITEALDKLLILHADHEQNASTSTVRLAVLALQLREETLDSFCVESAVFHSIAWKTAI